MRRRRWTRPVRSRFVRLAVNAALILWGGLLLVAILNRPADTERGADPTVPGHQARRPADENKAREPLRARRSDEPGRLSSSRPSDDTQDSVDSSGTTAQAGEARPPSADGPDNDAGVENGSDDANLAAEIQPRGASGAENAAGPPASDIARLETGPESVEDAAPGQVARAQFTSGIRGLEPINRVTSVFSVNGEVFSLDGRPLPTLYYFTEITGMGGETVIHRWEYQGITVEKVSFDIGDDRYRVYSGKDLPPDGDDDWRVIVTDAQGNVIKTDSFSFNGS